MAARKRNEEPKIPPWHRKLLLELCALADRHNVHFIGDKLVFYDNRGGLTGRYRVQFIDWSNARVYAQPNVAEREVTVCLSERQLTSVLNRRRARRKR